MEQEHPENPPSSLVESAETDKIVGWFTSKQEIFVFI